MAAKSRSTAFLLCSFFGLLGVHRFYLNKVGTGILMLLTGGGLLIWWLVDMVLIASGRMRDKAGDELDIGPPDPDHPQAGFWVRLAAISVDFMILNVIAFVLAVITAVVLPLLGIGTMHSMSGTRELGAQGPQLVGTLAGGAVSIPLAVIVLYFALQTASRHQATVGKRCFGLRVSARDGSRPGLVRALWRSVCYLFSALPLYLGFVIAGFTRNKRALHDYLAGTQVLYASEAAAAVQAAPRPRAAADTAAQPLAATGAPAAAAPGAQAARAPAALMVLGAVLIAAAAALALLG